MALIEFENQDKYFIKFFLLDATLNLNSWGVTQQSLEKNLQSFVGKPFVLTPDFNHPDAIDGDDLLIQQEKYRVGDIIMVGIENRTGKAYGVAEITDEKAKDILKNGEVNFVSPSIVFNNSDEVDIHGNAIIEDFEGAHVAAVAEPAYTVSKAQIKGKCAGDKDTCLNNLNKVEASVSSCGKFRKIKLANSNIVMANKECVQKCIDKKVADGIDIDDQALAICHSECYDSKEADEKFNDGFLSMMYQFWNKLRQPSNASAGHPEDNLPNVKSKGRGKDPDDKPKKKNNKGIPQERFKKVVSFIDDYMTKNDELPEVDHIATELNIPEDQAEHIRKSYSGDMEVTTKNKKKITMPKKALHKATEEEKELFYSLLGDEDFTEEDHEREPDGKFTSSPSDKDKNVDKEKPSRLKKLKKMLDIDFRPPEEKMNDPELSEEERNMWKEFVKQEKLDEQDTEPIKELYDIIKKKIKKNSSAEFLNELSKTYFP
tara:strand:+ start:9914 stop:11374 length:1461 start_codon:yes stop_codon:yes gene_type:complete